MKNLQETLAFTQVELGNISHLEWLVTNGLGGYASSTVCGMNTRRYHGLLVAAMNPPVERRVFVSRVEEALHHGGRISRLSTNQYPGAIYPQGYAHLHSFSRSPFPTATFEVEGKQVQKTIMMVHGSPTTVVAYHNPSQEAYELRVRPHFMDRDFHDLFVESSEFDFHTEESGDILAVYPRYGESPVFMYFPKGTYAEDRAWNKSVEYVREQQRGMEFQEDSYTTGVVTFKMAPGQTRYLVFSLEASTVRQDPAALMKAEVQRQETLTENLPQDPWFRDLAVSGDQFIVRRKSTAGNSLIAGYHWFGDWGRDTMISMRGLTLATGRKAEAKSIFQTFLAYLDQGMLPHRFPDQGEEPEYKSIDASLWLFVSLYEYLDAFGDWAFIGEALPKLKEILDAYIRGTRFNTHVTKEGFVYAGTPNSQLTWMDAYIWGYAVTARWGCPVEINALWYNALKIYTYFAEYLQEDATSYLPFATRIEENFRKHFLHPMGYLYDVVVPGEEPDERIRPNQIFVLSLPFKLLTISEAERVLQVVRQHLYTPLGLRTLSPADPEFKAQYAGNAWNRDTAYHQGTVWSLLLPEFLEAFLWVQGDSAKARKWTESALKSLKDHFYAQNCLWGISEIFDGKNPDLGKGTIHQAWSVGNLLRLIYTHDLFKVPKTQQQSSVQVPF